jgi:propanol-preferring alcohol dehydrogenase
MRAMLFEGRGRPLRLAELPEPRPGPGQVLVRVTACGVCRTDLHIVDGDLGEPKLPLILGHEVVGVILELGAGVAGLTRGERIGIPWLGRTCGNCRFCCSARENLCEVPAFTGYTVDGGYAERTVADARFCFRLPETYGDAEVAPLLCAGLIGYRSYRMAGPGPRLGLYGFGAAAHILCQLAVQDGREVFAFTRDGDHAAQAFARRLGAVWAGSSGHRPPVPLDAAILFAPAGELVPRALAAVDRGGIVVCGGIHMSEIPAFPYRLLWQERVLRSVANLERRDGEDLFARLAAAPVRTEVVEYPLAAANEALADLRGGRLSGAAVLRP